MKKSLESVGGLLIIGGVAGLVHRFLGWAPFGFVARVARLTPFVRDNEVVTYVALILLGLAALVVAGNAGLRDGEEPQGSDG